MSAHTVARWNAIPLDRDVLTLKRGMPVDEEDDDDDDISLISRSPSPLPHDPMDVDEAHLNKYDEYVRGPAREVITVETRIKPSNKGFALLSKLGWVEGQPVGLSADGRVDPIPFHIKSDQTGLGKMSQDVRMIEETVSQRRGLDSERQQKESEEQRKQREDSVARKSALESEISSTLRAFYCTLCDKQFKNVAQYDEHTNSYAHHHKARFRDMQANVRLKPQDEIDKRKEKERRREEKELRKIAAANGIKMPKPAAIPSLNPPPAPPSDDGATTVSSSMEVDGMPAEPKKSGWASISGSAPSQGTSGSGFSNSSWATVGPSNSTPPPPPVSSSSPSTMEHALPPNQNHIPTFRNAGWTSLDTGSSQPRPPGAPPTHEPPPPPPSSDAPASRGGWSRGASSPSPSASLGLGSGSSRQWQSSFAPAPPPPASAAPPPPSMPPPPAFQSHAPAPVPENKPVRSNWQQFQKGVGRRK